MPQMPIQNAAYTLFGPQSPEAMATSNALASTNLYQPIPYQLPVTSALSSAATAPLVPAKQNLANLTTYLPAGTANHNFKITLPPRTTVRLRLEGGTLDNDPVTGGRPTYDPNTGPGLEIRNAAGSTLLVSHSPALFPHKLIVTPDNPNPVDYWMILNNCEYQNPEDTALTVLVRVMSTSTRPASVDYSVNALLRWVAKAEVAGEETRW